MFTDQTPAFARTPPLMLPTSHRPRACTSRNIRPGLPPHADNIKHASVLSLLRFRDNLRAPQVQGGSFIPRQTLLLLVWSILEDQRCIVLSLVPGRLVSTISAEAAQLRTPLVLHENLVNMFCEKESVKQKVELQHDDPNIIKYILDYCYMSDFHLDSPPEPDSSPTVSELGSDSQLEQEKSAAALMELAQIYIVADKYQVEGLPKLACTKLHRHLHNGHTWKPEKIAEVARLVYSETIKGAPIRQVLQHYVLTHNLAEFVQHEQFSILLLEKPEFLLDLFKLLSLEVAAESCACCGSMQGTVLIRECCPNPYYPRGQTPYGEGITSHNIVRSFFPGVSPITVDRWDMAW